MKKDNDQITFSMRYHKCIKNKTFENKRQDDVIQLRIKNRSPFD